MVQPVIPSVDSCAFILSIVVCEQPTILIVLRARQLLNIPPILVTLLVSHLLKSKEEIIKSNKTNIISLKLQNEKYSEIIDKLTKTN